MLKLKLVDDEKVLWEIPLQVRQWDRNTLRREFDEMEKETQRFREMFNALANRGRMRMMRALLRDMDRPMGFSELMNELEMNPKIVSDSTRRLRRSGFIEKNDEGKYETTRIGEAQFLMMNVVLRRMLDFLDEIWEEKE